MVGLLVTIFVPRGKKSMPTMLSRTLDLPEDYPPITTIYGSDTLKVTLERENTSCNLFIKGISFSICFVII